MYFYHVFMLTVHVTWFVLPPTTCSAQQNVDLTPTISRVSDCTRRNLEKNNRGVGGYSTLCTCRERVGVEYKIIITITQKNGNK